MMKLEHRFVDFIPKEVDEGILFISIRFKTAVHNCACGCGNKTVTPFSPTDWKLIFDGKTISIKPSIGNWSFPCRSHYWITSNKIIWASDMTDERIEDGRRRNRLRKESYYSESNLIKTEKTKPTKEESKSWWRFNWLFKK